MLFSGAGHILIQPFGAAAQSEISPFETLWNLMLLVNF